MAKNDRRVWNAQDTGTTVMTGIVAGTVTGGPTFLMDQAERGTLSALVALDAETNTITLRAYWQVSNDASTFYEVIDRGNASPQVWAVGTAGADATVTRVLEAPSAVYAARYARVAVVNEVVNGLIADTYRIGYNFIKDESSGGALP